MTVLSLHSVSAQSSTEDGIKKNCRTDEAVYIDSMRRRERRIGGDEPPSIVTVLLKRKKKTTAPRIPAWSPTVVLTRRHSS